MNRPIKPGPDIDHPDEQNPIWGFPSFHIEKTRSWRSISADVVSRTAGEMVWRSDLHRTVYALTDIFGTMESGGGSPQNTPLLRDNFSLIPSGVTIRADTPAPIRFIQILQSPATYDGIISDTVRGGTAHLEPRTALHDPLVSQIASTIANEIDHGLLDDILADALNTVLAVQIVRHYVDRSAISLTRPSGLSRERLQRVCDYIEAHLDNRMTLTDLAAVACLSPYHFSRSFKQAVGAGPQRYVMQRRLERAKTLMRRTDRPLAWIAQETGFADQSHLTSIFRRETRVTPGQYRALA
jgi:AraC family transcriptional regulator